MRQPTKRQLITTIDETDLLLAEMVGRWSDGIPAWVRAELMRLRTPVLDVLIQARRRGQPVRPPLRPADCDLVLG